MLSARRTLAKRTRLWKIDGQYKTAKILEGDDTAALVVSQEEGFLVAPPGPAWGESSDAFSSYLGALLDFHQQCNWDDEDLGMHVAWLSDDFEHHRYSFGSIFLSRYEHLLDLGSGSEQEKIDRMMDGVRRGTAKGCLFGVDVKHKEIALDMILQTKVPDRKLYQKCFGVGQSRFSYPLRPPWCAVQAGAPLSRGERESVKVALVRAVRWPAYAFIRWARYRSRRFVVASCRRFMSRADVVGHSLWVDVFGRPPPWGEVARVAALVKARLHPAAFPWCWESKDEYIAEVWGGGCF